MSEWHEHEAKEECLDLRKKVAELEALNARLGTDLDTATQHVCKLESAEAKIHELKDEVATARDEGWRIGEAVGRTNAEAYIAKLEAALAKESGRLDWIEDWIGLIQWEPNEDAWRVHGTGLFDDFREAIDAAQAGGEDG